MKRLCCLIFLLLLPTFRYSHAAEDWVVEGRFRLCLREDGSADSGHAFLFRDNNNELGCMRGFYSRDVNKGTISFRFPEAWYGTRESGTIWWRLAPSACYLDQAPWIEFDIVRDGEKLLLTHNPKTGLILGIREDYFANFRFERGEVLEFGKATRIGLTEDQMPPSLNEVTAHGNRYESSPKSIWALGQLVSLERLGYVSDADHNLVGLAAMILKPHGNNPFSGTAWLIHHRFENGSFQAGKGKFTFVQTSDDLQAYNLNLSFPKTYKHKGGTGAGAWRADVLNETGLTLRIPLTDRGFTATPRGYVSELFFIDEAGRRQKRFVKQRFLDELVRGAIEQEAYPCLSLTTENSIEFRTLESLTRLGTKEANRLQQLLLESRPPGFQQSSIKQTVSLLSKAKAALNNGDTKSAIAGFEKHFATNPGDESSRLFYAKGIQKFDKPRSVQAFRALVRINPSKPIYRLHLGFALIDSNPVEAIEHCRAANKMTDNKKFSSHAFEGEGNAWSRLKQHKNAFAAYYRAFSNDSSNLSAGNSLTWAYANHAEKSWHDSMCEKFVRSVTPENCGANYWIYLDTVAAYKAYKGDFDEAIKLQRQVIKNIGPKFRAEAKQGLYFYKNNISLKEGKDFREWSLRFGNERQHFARLLKNDGKIVELVKMDGTTEKIAISRFSQVDQDFLKNRHRVAKPILEKSN